jgi:hypothetical protein
MWTVAIPDQDVKVNFAAGRAEMHVHDLAVEDYFTFPNSSIPGNEVDATVSFDVVWGGPVTRLVNVRDAANGFAGTFAENQATITWSASNEEGFVFVSDPGNFKTSVPEGGPFAELGHERNGIFFPAGPSGGHGNTARTAAPSSGTLLAASVPAPGSAAPGQTALDAALVRAVAGSSAPRETARQAPLPPRGGDAPAAEPVDSGHPLRPPAGPQDLSVGAKLPHVLDHVFADLAEGTLADPLGPDGLLTSKV